LLFVFYIRGFKRLLYRYDGILFFLRKCRKKTRDKNTYAYSRNEAKFHRGLLLRSSISFI